MKESPLSTPIVIDHVYSPPGYTWSSSYHYLGQTDKIVLLDDFPRDDPHLLFMVRDRLEKSKKILLEIE